MTCQVILEFYVKDHAIEDLRAWLQRILPDTRGFEGCVNIAVTQNQDDPTAIAVVEQWVTRQHYEKYLQWRTDTGSLGELVAMMSGEPTFRFFDYFGV
jgi:quinol monooxygenase YgiN